MFVKIVGATPYCTDKLVFISESQWNHDSEVAINTACILNSQVQKDYLSGIQYGKKKKGG